MNPAHCSPAPHVPTPYLIVVLISIGAGGCSWVRCGHLRPPRRVRSWMRKGIKNGTLAMIIYAIVVLPAPSVADGRVCAGFKGLDEEVVVQ